MVHGRAGNVGLIKDGGPAPLHPDLVGELAVAECPVAEPVGPSRHRCQGLRNRVQIDRIAKAGFVVAAVREVINIAAAIKGPFNMRTAPPIGGDQRPAGEVSCLEPAVGYETKGARAGNVRADEIPLY